VEIDLAMGGGGAEIRCDVVDSQRHGNILKKRIGSIAMLVRGTMREGGAKSTQQQCEFQAQEWLFR